MMRKNKRNDSQKYTTSKALNLRLKEEIDALRNGPQEYTTSKALDVRSKEEIDDFLKCDDCKQSNTTESGVGLTEILTPTFCISTNALTGINHGAPECY
jgi:hypothetical protein